MFKRSNLIFLSVGFIGLLLTLTFFSLKKEKVVVFETYESSEKNFSIHNHNHEYEDVEEKGSALKKRTDKVSINRKPAQAVEKEAFKIKSEEILSLSKTYPKGRDELLKIVSSKDIFKESGRTPEPHTVNDLKQQQEGALKVMALRVLMENESRETFKKDLSNIIKEAKDPTMSKIAEAVLKSVEEGGSFFEDMPEAIKSL